MSSSHTAGLAPDPHHTPRTQPIDSAAFEAEYAAARPISDEERRAFRAAKQGELLPAGAALERKRGADALRAG